MARKAAYVQEIEDAIGRVQRRINRHARYDPDEEWTKKRLIEPILAALGWTEPVFELQTGNGPVDYAFYRSRNRPWLLVEAKRLSYRNLHNNYPQLRKYARGLELTEGFGVITNGDLWRIFDLRAGYIWGGNLIHKISIVDDELDVCVDALKVLRR